MGGLWKLAAMSAVIGAGLVVVWQAQTSLDATGDAPLPVAPALADTLDDFDHPEHQASPLDPSADHSAPSFIPGRPRTVAAHTASPNANTASASPTLLTAADAPQAGTAPVAEPVGAANASVPPESNAALLPPGNSSRSRSGLDFRRSEDLTVSRNAAATTDDDAGFPMLPIPAADAADALPLEPQPIQLAFADRGTAPELLPDNDARRLPVRQPLRTFNQNAAAQMEDNAPGVVRLVSGEKTTPATTLPRKPTDFPDDDPFFDAAPPRLDSRTPAASPNANPALPTTPAANNRPVPGNATGPASELEDPFGDSAPMLPSRTAPSRSATAPGLPDEADIPPLRAAPPAGPAVDLFDDFDDAPPAMRTPPARGATPLPDDLDDSFGPLPALPNLTEPMPTGPLPSDQPPTEPSRTEPSRVAPLRTEPAFDPFEDEPPAMRTPPTRSATPLPDDLDDNFGGSPSAPAPNRVEPSRIEPLPAGPLPSDQPGTEPTRTEPSRVAPLRSEPAFDPFADEPPPARTPPARSVTPLPDDLDDPQPVRSAPPARSPESAPPARTPPARELDADLMQGDGEIGRNTPRGVQEPRLTIEKFAPASAVLGQPLIYSVIVKNVGGSPASQVTVEDRIPKGTRLVGTAPQAEMIDKRLVWRKLGTLQPGEERKISIKVIPEEEGPIGSVAKVSFISEVAAEIVVQAPKLKVTVSVPNEARMGAVVPLVFTISNPGNGDATNVVLRSIIPEELQHPAGSDLEYTVGKLAANETREVRLEVTAIKPGLATHQTIVTGDGNLTAESRDAVEIIGEQLLLTRSGHDRVYLGRNAQFSNSVTNEGKRPVNNVKLSEVVPEGFDFVSATHGGQFSNASRTVTWNVGTLAPDANATVSVTLVAKGIGRFDSSVTATGPGGSVATVRPNVSIEGYPALALERLGEERLVAVGETITTKIQLQNRGSGAANQVTLVVDLPTELKLVSANGPSSHRVEGQRLIFDPVDQVAPRGSAGYELVLEAQSPGDSRLEMQLSAEHLRRPVRHDEALQVIPAAR